MKNVKESHGNYTDHDPTSSKKNLKTTTTKHLLGAFYYMSSFIDINILTQT